jgi:hypothetical protein
MNPTDLASILCRHGIIQREAIEDPEGYDAGATMDAVALADAEIDNILAQRFSLPNSARGTGCDLSPVSLQPSGTCPAASV